MNITQLNGTDIARTEADHHITSKTLQTLEIKYPLWSVVIIQIFLVIVFVTGIVGNTVIMRIVTSERKRSSTDWFILFLAISDFICSSLTVPVAMFNNLKIQEASLPSIMCKIHLFIYSSTYLTSMFFFILLGIDRYLKICYPRIKNYIADRPCLVGSLVTLFAMILGANRFRTTEVDSNGICLFDATGKVNIQSLTISSALTLLSFAVCFMYYKVIAKMKTVSCQLWHNSTSTASQNQQKQKPSGSRIFPKDSEKMPALSGQPSASYSGTLSYLRTNLQPHAETNVESEPSQMNSQDHEDKQEQTKVKSSEVHMREIKAVQANPTNTELNETINNESSRKNEGVQINDFEQSFTTAAKAEQNKMTRNGVSTASNRDEIICPQKYAQHQRQQQNVINIYSRNANILSSTRVLVFMTAMYIVFTIIPSNIAIIMIACNTLYFLEGHIALHFLSKLFYVNVVINVLIYYKLRTGFRTKVKEMFRIRRPQIFT